MTVARGDWPTMGHRAIKVGHNMHGSYIKLPKPSQTYPIVRANRYEMPCTSGMLDHCVLPRITGVKRDPKNTVLPRLNSIHKSVYGARLGLFEWPELLPRRIYSQLYKNLKVKGVQPLPHDFKNSQGLLQCPLCQGLKEFVRLNRFVNHLLDKH
jgi:hypothetical protein